HASDGLVQCAGLRPIEILRQNPVFRGVVAERKKERVRHVRLETQGLWPADHLKQFGHTLPAMHSAPADLAFGGQPLAKIFCDITRFAKRLGDPTGVRGWILSPIRRACGGINSHDPVASDAQLAELLTYRTGFSNLR